VKARALGIGWLAAVGALWLHPPAIAVATESDAGADGADPRGRAQALLEGGNRLFRAGDLAGALTAYLGAYEVFPSPKLFFNIARCEEELAKNTQAANHFTHFLREAIDADPGDRAYADERVRTLTAALVGIELVGAPPNAAVQVDGVPAGLTPLEQVLWVEPGRHSLSVTPPGRPPWLASVDGKAGSKIALTVPSAPPSLANEASRNPPPTLPAHPEPRRTRWWLWAGIGAVVVGGAVATFLILHNRCPATMCE
jgi:hypothetical protein